MSMRTRRRRSAPGLAAMVVALVLAAGLAGCSDDSPDGAGGTDAPSTTAPGQGRSGRRGSGTQVGSGERYQATIRRTTGGVAHITGDTLADAAYGQGWASGEDRSCDLADQIVKIRGERAKWFGAGEDDANIDSDVAWRAIGIFDQATEDWKTFPRQGADLINAFADGWNGHLREVGKDKLIGWCRGEEWVRQVKPEEIYAYARAIALQASSGAVARYIPSAAPPGDGTATSGTSIVAGSTTTTTTTTTTDSTTSTSSTTAGSSTTATAKGSGEGALGPGPAGIAGPIASNGWAIGAQRSAAGGGMLMANPHFPWEGELRFWEVQLTVPGQLDIYGVQLSGLPGIGIGFTKTFGWTHTVSAGNRFTAYKLSLVPGSPTKYRYGDEERDIVPTDQVIDVKGDDGKLTKVTRTTWASHYGPIIDFPGFGWTKDATITFRDANLDDDEFLDQYLSMMQADDLDEFIKIHERVNGIPLFNTIATSADGRAWYADTSATPNLSSQAIDAYEASLTTDPIAKAAADAGAVLLDGSNPKFEWVDEPGARDPGLVPYARQPKVERDDYVFNANDSFWLPNADHLLQGNFSPLHGRQETPRSPRTRENAVVLDDTTPEGASGADGKFTLDELADASLGNEGFMARTLRADVVGRCQGASPVAVPAEPAQPAEPGEDQLAGLPAAAVDIGPACDVLAGWDGIYDLDRAGPPLWRELLGRFDSADLRQAGPLWAEAFNPSAPIQTPSGLAAKPGGGAPDPILVNLARAVQVLDLAGLKPDAELGDVQFARRDGQRIPIHGGTGTDGTTNVVGYGTSASILDPALTEAKRELLVDGSSLARVDGEEGYLVNNGTSFLLALAFTKDGPQAKVFLTYSNTEDRKAEDYTAATERFSKKDWRDVAFTDAEIDEAEVSTETVKG